MRFLVALLLLIGVARAADASPNQLPPEIRHVLDSANNVALFSLEPWDPHPETGTRLEGFKILGSTRLDVAETRTAVDAFEDAVKHWDGLSDDCFDPRHALQIVSDGHIYDFLLCFSCHQLVVYKDGKQVVGVGASGGPDVLNNLLRKHRVPISHSGDEHRRPAG